MKLKKALSLTLALALSLAMAVPSFAAPVSYKAGYGDFTRTITMDVAWTATTTNAVSVLERAEWSGEDAVTIIAVDPNTPITTSDNDDVNLYEAFEWDGSEYHIRISYGTESMASGETLQDVIDRGGWTGPVLFYVGFESMDETEFEPLCFLACAGRDLPGLEFKETIPAQPDAPTQPVTPTQPVQPEQPVTPAQPEQPAVPAAAGTYTVKAGDSWSSICTNFYGSNAQRTALQKANKGVKFQAGAVITLPEKLGNAARIPAPTAGAGEKLYTVKAGDTLGKIAAAEYGQTALYKAIFERNADRLKNANTIYEGQVIVLPAKG